MSETFTARVWVLGDDIDTDIIIPTEYLALKTIDDMKQYGFSPLRPELAGQIRPGDVIVAGKNFGCGSSLPIGGARPWPCVSWGFCCPPPIWWTPPITPSSISAFRRIDL